jgi:Eco57I restriction-modification methylase/TaqI-like C-terminal specificity domain
MVDLCRGTGVRLGLLTNGEQWMLVDAPVGAVISRASWYARHWSQEPATLQAFVSLLGVRRFFDDRNHQLPALLDKSLKHQDEVTDALGEQVARAVEVLIQAFDRADADRNRKLLHGVEPSELYEAGLTVMMRIVFLLAAEERGLLLLGEEGYEANYAVSTLRAQLREESEEILERRGDAWSRLLSIFRVVFAGVDHEEMRLPALGGSLFDPDRFPFLEGRKKGSHWKKDLATPLPIDNRTVLYLLEAVQLFQGRTLSYEALDIEQIGYVYEGLLERTVVRTDQVTLDLDASKDAKNPSVSLPELDDAAANSRAVLEALLKERTESSPNRVHNDLEKPVDEADAERLLTACHNDVTLRNRIRPYFHLLRTDRWGYPLVYPRGAFRVAKGADRGETGTHYTPTPLTQAIVKETLEPLVYDGPAQGAPRESWKVKSPAILLELKICDVAMGSGAFLVQVCRWLAKRLVEAWAIAEGDGRSITADGEVVDYTGTRQLLDRNTEERLLTARRLIAERCLYGVDINPLAVELAKLSIWLITLARGRPFGFLDHNFKCGDSLLGIHVLDQLTELDMASGGPKQYRLFGKNIERAVRDAVDLRQRLRATPIRDIRDVEAMARLDQDARDRLSVSRRIAHAFMRDVLHNVDCPRALETSLSALAALAELALEGDRASLDALYLISRDHRNAQQPNDSDLFHWPIEFPEVFCAGRSGFDAVVSNPPWGAIISPQTQAIWKRFEGEKLGRIVDSFHLFLIRASQLLDRKRLTSAGLLVPDVLLYQSYSEPLRRSLLTSCRVTSVCNIGNAAFTRVTRPCCYVVFSMQHQPTANISVSKWRTDSAPLSFELSPESLQRFPGCIIPTNDLAQYHAVARLVSSLPYRLSNVVDDYGIQRGASADNKDIFVLTDELASREKLETAYLRRVVVGGVHLRPFRISDDLPLLIYTTRDTPERAIPNIVEWVAKHADKVTCKEVRQNKHPIHALHRPREKAVFERETKLMGVVTADRPKVAVDTKRLYALDGIFLFGTRDDVDPYYVAGVLNSTYMARIYRVFSQEEGRVMAQVKPTIIADLPIVHPRTEDRALAGLVSRISNLSRQLHVHGSETDEELRTTLMAELEHLVENLYSRWSVLPNGSLSLAAL